MNGKTASEIVSICIGGKTRQESVHRGLKEVKECCPISGDDVVLIHDAARPFVACHDIEALLNTMKEYHGASLAYKSVDTCRSVNEINVAQEEISRDDVWSIQTPQAFRYATIIKAHAQCDPHKVYTDDTSIASDSGCSVVLVPASKYNFKITTQEDIHMADRLLSTAVLRSIRTGMGYDVHAFDDDVHPVEAIRLCGVDIKHDRKLKGHSDADVGLHALCDAIYGAIGAGDIGVHFPPSNDEYKDMDSSVFLEQAISLLRDKKGELINADITLVCEQPKIGEYREKMVKRIAQIMKVSELRINIKATTTEKLGFAGRKEGIAAQAVVNVSLPEE
jgi:2-C-methyl-D-erythritol 4-phosphate cytidylyltransferase/2-C-methyl-D-erythritol 2,4-cyclodiphosphate synthase